MPQLFSGAELQSGLWKSRADNGWESDGLGYLIQGRGGRQGNAAPQCGNKPKDSSFPSRLAPFPCREEIRVPRSYPSTFLEGLGCPVAAGEGLSSFQGLVPSSKQHLYDQSCSLCFSSDCRGSLGTKITLDSSEAGGKKAPILLEIRESSPKRRNSKSRGAGTGWCLAAQSGAAPNTKLGTFSSLLGK